MEKNIDKIKNIILRTEELKQDQKYKDAIKIVEEAITKYSFDYRLYEELADIYLYSWELKKAQKAIDFWLELNSDSATGNYLKWFLLLTEEKPEKAISYLEKSNSLAWNNPEVLRNLGWANVLLWEFDKWISILKRALIIAPWDELITEDLAMALIWAWDFAEWNWLLKSIWKTGII